MKEEKSAKFYSPEHKQHFEAKDIQLKVEKDPSGPNILSLSLNGQNILEWFGEQFDKLRQTIKPHIKPAPPAPKKGQAI